MSNSSTYRTIRRQADGALRALMTAAVISEVVEVPPRSGVRTILFDQDALDFARTIAFFPPRTCPKMSQHHAHGP